MLSVVICLRSTYGADRIAVSSVVAKALPVAITIGTEAVRVVGLLVIVAVAAKLAIVLAVTQSLIEVVHAPASIAVLIGWIVPKALLVALSVGTEVASATGLLMIVAVAAVLAIVLAVPQTLLEIADVSASIVLLFVGRNVSEALSVAVLVGTEVVRIVGLLVVVTVAAKLAVVLAVTQALLKGPSVVPVLAISIMILALLRGNRGSKTRRAKPGEGDSKSQHPYCLFHISIHVISVPE